MLWIPFGLNIGFVSDGWHHLSEVDQGGHISVPLRPFLSLAWRIVYLVLPESFIGFNLLLSGLLFLKSILLLQIAKEVGLSMWFAFALACVAIMIPADTGIFWLGALVRHLDVVNLLLATWALVRYWKYKRLTSLIIMWLALGLAAGSYEVTFVFAAAAPLLLILLNRGLSRRVIRVTALWYAVPLAFGLRYASLLISQPTSGAYQNDLLDLSASVGELFQSTNIALQRHFLSGWLILDSPIVPGYLALGLLAGIIAFLVSRRLMRVSDLSPILVNERTYLYVFLAGALIMVLGLLPFLITNLRMETTRTYYYSSIGASLIVTALLGWIFVARLQRPALFAGGLALLAGLGMMSLLHQHARWVDYSVAQQRMSSELIHELGAILPGTTIVVVDESSQPSDQAVFGASWYLSNIVNILYQDYTLRAVICDLNVAAPWGSMSEGCQFGSDGITFTLRNVPMYHATYDSIVVVRHLDSGRYEIVPDLSRLGLNDSGYDPSNRVSPSGPLPTRLETLFGIRLND